jgi:hypothetical protein
MRSSDALDYLDPPLATAAPVGRADDEIVNTGTIVAMADLGFLRYLPAEVPAGSKRPERLHRASRRRHA